MVMWVWNRKVMMKWRKIKRRMMRRWRTRMRRRMGMRMMAKKEDDWPSRDGKYIG